MALHIVTGRDTLTLAPREGENLADAAARAGLTLNARCGGLGVCAGCRVYLEAGRFAVDGVAVDAGDRAEPLLAPACRTQLAGTEGRIRFPPLSLAEDGGTIDDRFEEAAIRRLRPPPPMEAPFGVAADIGTTTVAVLLADLRDGRILRRAAMYNQQIGRADDVASRISYACTPQKRHELQRLLIDRTLNPLLDILCARAGIEPCRVGRMVLSGNTVMTHLCYGLSPQTIGRLPFDPLTRIYPSRQAAGLGLAMHAEGAVEALPSIAGYLGGDLVADWLVTELEQGPPTALLMDIGTNGEMLLHHEGRLTACATAAGPAFEGAGLDCGCRAAAGAIDQVALDANLGVCMRVIGGGAPKGLCGSGVVDFMAEAMRCGLLGERGRYDLDRLRATGRYLDVGPSGRPVHACLLAPAEESLTARPVYVSEADVAHILKAKAAVFAGLQTLLEQAGLRFEDLDRIHLAGGFARYLSLDNAMHIGMLPDLPAERYRVVGNGSLAGAYRVLTEEGAMAVCEALIDRPGIVHLNLDPGFEGRFIDALALPHMDPALFPGRPAPSRPLCKPLGEPHER